jgi:hypothetical protein
MCSLNDIKFCRKSFGPEDINGNPKEKYGKNIIFAKNMCPYGSMGTCKFFCFSDKTNNLILNETKFERECCAFSFELDPKTNFIKLVNTCKSQSCNKLCYKDVVRALNNKNTINTIKKEEIPKQLKHEKPIILKKNPFIDDKIVYKPKNTKNGNNNNNKNNNNNNNNNKNNNMLEYIKETLDCSSIDDKVKAKALADFSSAITKGCNQNNIFSGLNFNDTYPYPLNYNLNDF